MVCLSGGKDSYTLLDMLLSLQRGRPCLRAFAVNLDQKHPGFRRSAARLSPGARRALPRDRAGHVLVVRARDPRGPHAVRVLLRLRRGALYRYAREQGFTRIALGHHREDIVETLFLNMFYGGRLKAMPPKLRSDDGADVVIRPLAYVPEREIARYARAGSSRSFPAALRLAAEPAARVDRAHAGGVGPGMPGSRRFHLHGALQRGACAPCRSRRLRFRRARTFAAGWPLNWRASRCRTATGSSRSACLPVNTLRETTMPQRHGASRSSLVPASTASSISPNRPSVSPTSHCSRQRRTGASSATCVSDPRSLRAGLRREDGKRSSRRSTTPWRQVVACTCTAAPASAARISSPVAGSRTRAAAGRPRSNGSIACGAPMRDRAPGRPCRRPSRSRSSYAAGRHAGEKPAVASAQPAAAAAKPSGPATCATGCAA